MSDREDEAIKRMVINDKKEKTRLTKDQKTELLHLLWETLDDYGTYDEMLQTMLYAKPDMGAIQCVETMLELLDFLMKAPGIRNRSLTVEEGMVWIAEHGTDEDRARARKIMNKP